MGGSASGARGGAKAALKKNKYGRDGKGSGSARGSRSHGGESGDSVIPAEELIDWRVAKLSLLEEIQKKKKPIILFFIDEETSAVEASRAMHDATLAKMSKDGDAYFLIVEHNADRTPSMTTESPVPTTKLLDTNPARAYDIRNYPSVLVCDWHGNETRRFNDEPVASDLKRRIDEVSEYMTAWEEKLRKNLDEAKAEFEKKDMRKFFKLMNKNFREGLVGLDAQNEGVKLYRTAINDALDEVDRILEDRPKDGHSKLKKLSKDYRDTEIRKEIDDAIDIVKG
jgi:hypothetical protein